MNECSTCFLGYDGDCYSSSLDCTGELNGTAYLDECGVCIKNESMLPCNSVLEAETMCELDGSIDADNEGFSGSGYVNTTNEIGAQVKWALVSETTGQQTINFKYANGSLVNRNGSVEVNGVAVANLELAPSGGWSTWTFASVSVPVQEGDNELVISSLSDQGLANIDLLALPAGLSESQCIVTSLKHDAQMAAVIGYPNPTTTVFRLSEKLKWRLLDSQGHQVSTGNGDVINMSQLKAGFYIVKAGPYHLSVLKE